MPDWNQRYSEGEHANGRPCDLIRRVAREYPPGLALDLACGLGRHTMCLAEHGWQVVAIDNSEVAIVKLREAVRAAGLLVQSKVEDLEASDFAIDTERYDLICNCFYLQRSLIPRIRSGVRAGGLAVFVVPMVDEMQGLKPIRPDFLVRPGEVRSWFEDWDILEYREESDRSGQRMAAQLIARRPAPL